MAKAPVIEEAQMRHAFKVAAVTGQTRARDVALLHVLYGTGMTATELAQLEIADVLAEDGTFRRASAVRAAISFNGRDRPVYWTNATVCEAVDAYLTERIKVQQGTTAWRSRWRGLVHLGPVFLTVDGRPFTLTTRKTSAGNLSRSCESLTQAIRKLHEQAALRRPAHQPHAGRSAYACTGRATTLGTSGRCWGWRPSRRQRRYARATQWISGASCPE